jgi:ectoine hydroxylase-related dioxygenase (phytanoyl-CoA dioxygenase family)
MNFKKIKEELQIDGVALLPNLIQNNSLWYVKDAIQFSRDYPSPFGREIKNGESIFFHDFWTYRRNKSVGKILGLNEFNDALSKIIDINGLRFFHDHILFKSPGADATPWHHDRPYYLVDGPDNFSIWITPDSVNEDHSLAFICGSHLLPNEYTPVSFENSKVMGSYDSLLELRDSDISILSRRGIKVFRMSPGDAVIFNNKTLHRSLASSSSAVRTALSLRFVTKNSWLTKKFVNAAPPFHKMGMIYEEGDNCSDKWFPRYSSFLGGVI